MRSPSIFRGGLEARIAAAILSTWLATSAEAGEIYWIAQDESGSRAIGTANLDGTDVDPSLITPVVGGSVAVDDSYVYWAHGAAIGRANRDGTDADPSFLTLPQSTNRIAVDAAYVYWTNGDSFIGRANLDGTGADPYFIIAAGAHILTGLAVNETYVYWTAIAAAQGAVSFTGRANLDGTGRVELMQGVYWYGIEADERHLYFATLGGISRSDLDGTEIETDFITGGNSWDVAVDDEYVYWPNFSPGTIGRAYRDGGNVEPDFITGLISPMSVAVVRLPPTACGNGVDDDGDGLVDHPADPGCSSPFDEGELSTVQCDNGRDDDGDGTIDWRGDASGDPDCYAISDRSELPSPPPGCGLGPELAVLVPALWWMRRRSPAAR
jgi:hypothetical protein